MKLNSIIIKLLMVGTPLLLSVTASAQFGNTGEYVAGDGATTFSSSDQLNTNVYAPEAQCGTVTRFTRYQNGQVLSLPNNQTCQWILRDGNGFAVHTISQFQWNSAVGATYLLPGSNIKLSVNAINSTFIELLIERIDDTDCNTAVVGLDYQHAGSGGSNSINTIQHSCYKGCGDPTPISCPVTGTIQTCCDLNCIKLTKDNSNPLCPTCYCVQVYFTDGTKASFDASFSQGEQVMHCYDKPIASYTILEQPESECNECSAKGISLSKSLQKDDSDAIKIFPNPANNVFRIEGVSIDQITHVVVFSLSGKELKTFEASSEYSISELQVGGYLVKIYNGEIEIGSGRIIKK